MGRVIGMTDWEFSQDWMRFFGTMLGYQLLGWLLLCAMQGSDLSEYSLRRLGPLSRAQRYKNVAHLKRYAADLQARGLAKSEPDAFADLVFTVGLMAHAY